jgi:hypothetical protein
MDAVSQIVSALIGTVLTVDIGLQATPVNIAHKNLSAGGPAD